jgi:hypothetical protein
VYLFDSFCQNLIINRARSVIHTPLVWWKESLNSHGHQLHHYQLNVQSPLILTIGISVLRHHKLTIFWTFRKISIIGHTFKEKWHVNSYIRISLQLELPCMTLRALLIIKFWQNLSRRYTAPAYTTSFIWHHWILFAMYDIACPINYQVLTKTIQEVHSTSLYHFIYLTSLNIIAGDIFAK